MSKKPNILLSLIILSFLVSVCSISVVQENPSTVIKKQDDEKITGISAPTTSGYAVTEKWRWKNSFNFNPDAVQVEISLDGKYIVARYEDNPNVTLFKNDNNETVWIYENVAIIQDVAISRNGEYIVVCNGSHVICLDNSPEFPKTELWRYAVVGGVNDVDISLDGDYICAINNTAVFLLNKSGGVEWIHDVGTFLWDIAISGDEILGFKHHVIVGEDNGWVFLFNTTEYDQDIPMWADKLGGLIDKVAISDDGNYGVAKDQANDVYFFNTTDHDIGIPMWTWSTGNTIRDISISSDGKYIIVSDTDKVYYFNNSFYSGQKLPMWSYDPVDDTVYSDINADGTYVIAGTPAGPSAYLLKNNLTNPIQEWTLGLSIADVAISGWGDYFVLSMDNQIAPQGTNLILFHHARPIPPILRPLLGGDDDDDDDDEGLAIPIGNYYLVFAFAAIISLIVIIKRKAILSKD